MVGTTRCDRLAFFFTLIATLDLQWNPPVASKDLDDPVHDVGPLNLASTEAMEDSRD